ncbi:MAG: flavin reductase family protein [Amaricoccus sp.]
MLDFTERDLRNALGRFATGVTVVTTLTADGPLGITANSFASVSLNPPLVLWSPARKSSRFRAFERAPFFAIHVLGAGQRGLADRFTRVGHDFGGIEFAAGQGGTPLIDGCAARFECRHAAGHDGGDHLIVVGEVLRVVENEVAPLLFHRGVYTALAGADGGGDGG